MDKLIPSQNKRVSGFTENNSHISKNITTTTNNTNNSSNTGSMDPRNTHRHTPPQQASSDNSHQRSCDADPSSLDHDGQEEVPVFYLEGDDDASQDCPVSKTDTGHFHRNNNGDKDDARERRGRGVQCGAVAAPSPLDGQQTMRSDEGVMASTGSRTPQDSGSSGAQTPSDSWRTPPRSVPPVQRACSSPVSTVCRQSYSHLELKCQVNSLNSPLSSSCPAAFSPKWTQVVTPVARSTRSKGASYSSEKKRRHTVGPATHIIKQQRREEGVGDLSRSVPGEYNRSASDPALYHQQNREVGKALRKMSDEFNFVHTGQRLTPVTESTTDEEDSDDEI